MSLFTMTQSVFSCALLSLDGLKTSFHCEEIITVYQANKATF